MLALTAPWVGALSGAGTLVIMAGAYFITGVVRPREIKIQNAATAAAELIVNASSAAARLAQESAAAASTINTESALRNQAIDFRIAELLRSQEAMATVQKSHERRLDGLERQKPPSAY
jgi:hypothetical protein